MSFTAEAGTYQPMLVPAPPPPRTHRALMGISMGGAGMGIALRHPVRALRVPGGRRRRAHAEPQHLPRGHARHRARARQPRELQPVERISAPGRGAARARLRPPGRAARLLRPAVQSRRAAAGHHVLRRRRLERARPGRVRRLARADEPGGGAPRRGPERQRQARRGRAGDRAVGGAVSRRGERRAGRSRRARLRPGHEPGPERRRLSPAAQPDRHRRELPPGRGGAVRPRGHRRRRRHAAGPRGVRRRRGRRPVDGEPQRRAVAEERRGAEPRRDVRRAARGAVPLHRRGDPRLPEQRGLGGRHRGADAGDGDAARDLR